jgi:hypothetical protein
MRRSEAWIERKKAMQAGSKSEFTKKKAKK